MKTKLKFASLGERMKDTVIGTEVGEQQIQIEIHAFEGAEQALP